MKNNLRKFSINRIVFPTLSLPDFFAVVSKMGIDGVELRNDLDGISILDKFSPSEVNSMV